MFERKNKKQKLFHTAVLGRRPKPVIRRVEVATEERIRWDSAILWAMFLCTLVYGVFFSPWLMITDVLFDGESIIQRGDLERLVRDQMTGKKWRIFSKANYLLLSPKHIEQTILSNYPKFETVSVMRVFPRSLRIAHQEHDVLIRWCTGGPCYLLTKESVLISADRTEIPEYDDFRLSIIDESATPVHLKQELFLRPFMETFQGFYQKFPEILGVMLQQYAETPSRHAPELRMHTKEGWDILVSTERPFMESLQILRSLSELEENRDALQVVDLRTEGRVFVITKKSDDSVSKD